MSRSKMTAAVQALVEKLTPVAKSYLGAKLNADELRYCAKFGQNIDLNTPKPSVVSAAITRSLLTAGWKPTDRTISSLAERARGRRVLVWVRA